MKFRKILSLFVVGVAFMFTFSACQEEGTVTNDTAVDDVTLAGSINFSAAVAKQKKALFAVSSDPLDYKLYCVSFTSPPITGEGEFDASGAFSVTLLDAAGLAIGCFINNKTTNQPVTTVTFQTGDTSSIGGASGTSSAALQGGTHTVNINFDPATGVATADVTAVVDNTVVAGLTKADIAGSWNLSCATALEGNSAEEVTLCTEFLSQSPTGTLPVFANVLEGTMVSNGSTVYALAPWSSEAAYTACGSTEALTNLTDVSNVTQTASTVDPTTAFNGFTKEQTYVKATNSMQASDLLNYMVAKGFTDTSVIPIEWGTFCQDTFPTITTGLDLNDSGARSCLLSLYEVTAENEAAQCMPRIGSNAWNVFANNGSAVTSIPFETSLGGASVQLSGESRFDLMPMEIMANSAVATSFGEYPYTDWDEVTQTSIDCTFVHEMTLSISPDAVDATKALGRFTMKELDSCNNSNGNSYGSFFTVWTKQ